MKVHLIKKQSILDFIVKNAQSRTGFETWLSIIGHADWNEPADMVGTFNKADILGNGSNRTVFNIGGNKYRLICAYMFGKQQAHLFVKWMGTHAEYDKLCKKGEQYSVDMYK